MAAPRRLSGRFQSPPSTSLARVSSPAPPLGPTISQSIHRDPRLKNRHNCWPPAVGLLNTTLLEVILSPLRETGSKLRANGLGSTPSQVGATQNFSHTARKGDMAVAYLSMLDLVSAILLSEATLKP